MSSNVLEIPFRITEDVPLGEAITKIIENEFYQSSRSFIEDIREIDRLRHDIVIPAVSLESLGLLQKYYVNLQCLMKKMPDDLVVFPWSNTLGGHVSRPNKIKSLRFEALNVAYNIGALYSQLGYQQSRKSVEGMKISCAYFQFAAGAFAMLLKLTKDSERLFDIPSELQPEIVVVFKDLMLAQAQESIWQRAVGLKTRDSAIAKLAIQVKDFYYLAKEGALKTRAIPQGWKNHITLKMYHFQGAAYYRQSLMYLESGNHGAQVAFLLAASEAGKNATANTKGVSPAVLDDLQSFLAVLSEDARKAERDNDLIYLEKVPELSSLPDIKRALIAKAGSIDIEDIEACEKDHHKYGRPLFQNIIPFSVFRIAQSFKERQLEYVEKELKNPVRQLSNEMSAYLSSKGLPSAVEALERPHTLPDSIRQHSESIKNDGGVPAIVKSLQLLDSQSNKCSSILERCQKKIDDEELEDTSFREREGSRRWTRSNTKEAASKLISRIQNGIDTKAKASEGDQVINHEFTEIQDLLEIYGASNSENLLKERLPPAVIAELDPAMKSVVTSLSEKLKECRIIEENRDDFMESVDSKSDRWSIMAKMVSEYKTLKNQGNDKEITEDNFIGIYRRELSVFESDSLYVIKQREQQTDILKDVDKFFAKFSQLKEIGMDVPQNRRLVLQSMEDSFKAYKVLTRNIEDGVQFYSKFIPTLMALLHDCEAYAEGRQIEAREIMSKLSQVGIGANPSFGASDGKSSQGIWTPGDDIKFG
ncbi:unnamed protein product [Kuraishia capsulata CBS 1993]|uniref:BRO1 domain-containing protein n=1 Tax=Kuraishia capsulata CBS 1993 TaxID=1382522 RepID=W6MX79_9ASCO|nr:uncharacterized protein KUCA_T00004402001 [Kuraishia capsulata CBS 1993]CDK28420.1 unnamed protein product [Kuraishia capsulata CBS 1993]